MECERSDPSDPLRQGDIVAAQPTTEDWNNPWSRFGVILSADCDLAQGTTGPSLVYVPIVSHYTYLADVWLPAEAGQLVARGREMIDKRLADFDAKMSYRHLNAWGESGGAANIITRLGERLNSRATEVMPPKKRDEIIALWQAIQGLSSLSQRPPKTRTGELRPLLERLIEHRCAIERRDEQQFSVGQRMVESALTSLQDRLDAWLIRELIGLDPDMSQGSNFGFVVLLRAFSLLPVNRIETDRSKWYREQNKYLRICRLRGTYKADLVQKFANLFVRVGLEDHRNEEHRRLFKRCAQDLFPEVA
jgi:hypothetical protein